MLSSLIKKALFLLPCLIAVTGCDSSTPYRKKDGQWFYEKTSSNLPPSARLTQLHPRFARTDDEVFYRDERISGADSASFSVLDDQYAKDKSSVYFCDTYREGKDYYLTRNVSIKTIKGADTASFRALKDGYALDVVRPYFQGVPFIVQHVTSFEVLDGGFTRDRMRGYFERTEIAGSNGAHFIALDGHYAHDGVQAYYATSVMDGRTGRMKADVTRINAEHASLMSKSGGYAVDAAQVFYEGRVISRAPQSFELLTMSYAKTATEVFYQGAPIRGADVGSFVVQSPSKNEADASDRGASYSQGVRIAR
jgi:hypothetical protein